MAGRAFVRAHVQRVAGNGRRRDVVGVVRDLAPRHVRGGEIGRPADLGAADDGAAGRGTVSTAPGRITFGSGPMTCRLAAYRTCQPPRTASMAAIAAKVSPGTTL